MCAWLGFSRLIGSPRWTCSPTSRTDAACWTTSAPCRTRARLGASPTRCRRCCFWSCAAPSPPTMTMTTSSTGVRPISRSCAASARSTSGFPAPTDFGLPCADWLRTLMNRIDPDLFSACFLSWVREWWPEVPDLIALDGKTSRRSYDRKAGSKALHLVSAFATNERLVLGQEACAEKSNETTAIPALLARLAAYGHLKGALVSIDAVACNPDIAQAVVDGGADYLLAVKANQPTLHDEVVAFFDTAQAEDVEAVVEVDKDHGRIETRRCVVSRQIDWLTGERRFPGESRFAKLTVVAMVEARIELRDRCTVERRFYISSAPLSAARCAQAVRAHWP